MTNEKESNKKGLGRNKGNPASGSGGPVGPPDHHEGQLVKLNELLEGQVAQQTAMLKLLHDITRAANEARTVEEALRAALERIAQYNGWKVGHVWRQANDASGHLISSGVWFVSSKAMLADEALEEFQRHCQVKRYRKGEGAVGGVLATGQPHWLDDVQQVDKWARDSLRRLGLHACIAFPITTSEGVEAVLEFFSDHPARREERFIEIMPDVGIQLGHVIERKRLERQIADATEVEQRRVAGDIHDGVGQELTGLKYLAHTHAEALRQLGSPEAEMARRIVEGLETVQKQMRAIIRDLVPVEVDGQGLVAALRTLRERTETAYQVRCTFDCEQPVEIGDNLLATHLYRISQEAVANAVRHAQAGQIRIHLAEDARGVHLEVVDDGIGIAIVSNQIDSSGFGLRSMAYRADLIGAELQVGRDIAGGTVVRCTIPRKVNMTRKGLLCDGG